MTKKKIYIFLTIVFLFFIGSFGFHRFKKYAKTVKGRHCLTTRISSRLFDFNEFIVIVNGKLDKNDFEIINLNSGNVIFKDGKTIKGIKNEHGNCRFRLVFHDKEIYEFVHMKYNNWHTNDYELLINGDTYNIEPKLNITGPDQDNEIFYKCLD